MSDLRSRHTWIVVLVLVLACAGCPRPQYPPRDPYGNPPMWPGRSR